MRRHERGAETAPAWRARPPEAVISGISAKEASDLLFQLLLEVVRRHQPEIEPVLLGGANIAGFSPELMARALQAQGIWFQLLSIADQNAAMRRRRQIERTRGPRCAAWHLRSCPRRSGRRRDPAAGNPVAAVELAHQAGDHRAPDRIQARHRAGEISQDLPAAARARDAALDRTRAHRPHRRSARPDRARLDDGRAASGEADRAARGLARAALLRREPCSRRRRSCSAWSMPRSSNITPASAFELPPFLQYGSWIGGDRDGNPWVTTEVTAWTLRQNALASLRHYRERIVGLAKALSITERALAVPPGFRPELERALQASGEAEQIKARNPGEAYRQFLSIVLRKLDATIARVEGQDIGGPGAAYANADELIHDLRVIERALEEANSPSLAANLVKPVRRAVEIFRFSTVRLDLRENTTKTTAALQALWWATAGHGDDSPPELGSREWRSWLFRELARPLTGPRLIPQLPAEASELIDMFGQAAETRRSLDRDAFGSFILSMTRSVDDILGAYLLAKEGGAFLDAAGTEVCALPIVPLFETIARSPRRAQDHARGAVGAADPPLHALAGRGAGGDDRLFGLEQGRRLRRLQLGACQGAVAVDQGRRRAGHPDRLLPWARRLGLQRRRTDRPRHRRPTCRLDQGALPRHRAGRGGLLQICQQGHRALSDGAARRERVRARAEIRARRSAAAEARIRRHHGGAVRRQPRRLYRPRLPSRPRPIFPGGEPA